MSTRDRKSESETQQDGDALGRARATIGKGKELADKGKQLADKGKRLADKVQMMISVVLNLFTSVAVVISVVLGTKGINVSKEQLGLASAQIETSKEQLGLATQQIETTKEIAKTVNENSGGRGEAWEAALEAMLIDQAVANEEPALVRSFLPPKQLVVGEAPATVKIQIQSLSGGRLNGQVEGEVGDPLLCQLPGCSEVNETDCACQDPIRYNFVLPPMYERELELPIMLRADSDLQCRRQVEVAYTIKIQDKTGKLRRLTRREVRYQSDKKDCSPGATFASVNDDSWEGDPVTAEGGETGGETGGEEGETEGEPESEGEPEPAGETGQAAADGGN